MSATEEHGAGRDASVRKLETDAELVTSTSGFTRGQVLRRGLAGGLAVGAASVLPGVARAATRPRAVTQARKARRLRDQVADPTSINPSQVSFPNSQLVDLS